MPWIWGRLLSGWPPLTSKPRSRTVEVLHRWQHDPVAGSDGALRWDWPRIVAEVETGLERGLATGPVASIGVDGWGVDYGLIDSEGHLVALPYSYRDPRTEKWETTVDAIGTQRLYELTGVQIMGINTIFQLAVHDRNELEQATRLLLLPDLLVRHLGGFEGAERSNASTTGLLNIRTGEWAGELIEEIGVARSLFPDVVSAGLVAGNWNGVPIHLVGSHDTASAFLGMPGGSSPGTVFVSTGSWVIVGVERENVDDSVAARVANFSNEAGALGGTRFLKNVVGFWILEKCRAAWGHPPMELLMDEAASVMDPGPIFDAGDHRFVNPADMEEEIRDATGLSVDTPRSVIVRSVLDSIVDGIARVIDELASITETRVSQVAVVGGGARVPLLHELLGTRTGLRVVRGSPEATALGNAVVQGIALGRFDGIDDARGWLEASGV